MAKSEPVCTTGNNAQCHSQSEPAWCFLQSAAQTHHPREVKQRLWKSWYKVFMGMLVTTMREYQQPQHPPSVEQVNMCCVELQNVTCQQKENTTLCYNMYEPWKHAKGRKPMTKDGRGLWLHSYEMSKTWGGKTWERQKRQSRSHPGLWWKKRRQKWRRSPVNFGFVLFLFRKVTL